MSYPFFSQKIKTHLKKTFRTSFFVVMSMLLVANVVLADPEIEMSEDDTTVIVQNAPEQEVYVFGKSVIVRRHAKGVLAIGGDVTIEGRVEGDVATIGGNVIQKETGYIGGDVIVFFGTYKAESQLPLREPGKETVMFGVLEDEIKGLAQDPAQLFAPRFSWSFLVQRIIVALLWFIISITLTTIVPGAVSRAVAKISLNGLKLNALGAAAFILSAIVMIASAVWLPIFLSATVGAMGVLLMLFGYVFGRVALQISVGKFIQKRFFPENNRSETLATLTGVVIWTVLLSLPYIWMIALFSVFAMGIGLILTARNPIKRQMA